MIPAREQERKIARAGHAQQVVQEAVFPAGEVGEGVGVEDVALAAHGDVAGQVVELA